MRVMTPYQAAKFLGRTPTTLAFWRGQRPTKLPFLRLIGESGHVQRIFYRTNDVEHFREQRDAGKDADIWVLPREGREAT